MVWDAILRGLVVLFFTFVAARLTLADSPGECDKRLDGCRAACVDRFGRDEAELARCRQRCNQAWLGCGK